MKMKIDFTQIPNSLIKDPNISDAEFRTYAVLLSFKYGDKGRVFPSYKTLANIRYKSEKSIITHIKALTEYRVIDHTRRGFNKTNEYFIYDLHEYEKTKSDEINYMEIQTTVTADTCEILQPNNTEINNTKMKNNESTFTPLNSEDNSKETEKDISEARDRTREFLREKGILKK